MPKISASTVAEHRAARRAALLDAAVALLTEHPDQVPSLGDVGERAGLSRPSVYHYFPSREDLMAAVIEETFPRWENRFDAALAGVSAPEERIRAFVRTNLELVADGEHALARTLATVAPQEDLTARAAQFHDRLLGPVLAALDELGVPDPRLTADLVNALVLAAARELEDSGDLDGAHAAMAAILDPFLDARARRH